ncbi:MAG: PspC domain-containing protein, partial [Chloroflexi bacterium]|nr:PspC domain-containing protein [Chloroflexota bacterium]
MRTQLTRSMTDKKIAGVAGGVAEAFGWDVTLVRLGFIGLALLHGSGLLIYLILMLLMPKVGEQSLGQQAIAGAQHASSRLGLQDRNRTLGYVLLGLGALMLASILDISGPVIAIATLGAG